MGTGIVSVAMLSASQVAISRVLLAITGFLWLLLAAGFVRRLWRERERWRADASRPVALTAAAATAVLGSRLTEAGWSWAGWSLLAAASVLCLALGVAAMPGGFKTGTGASFLLVVAPESLAVLAGQLAGQTDSGWLAVAALVPFAVGLALYVPVLTRFDHAELREGGGDHWISGGSLGIMTLASAEISYALSVTDTATWLADPLRIAALVLWGLTIAWLPLLVLAEVRWRRVAYDVRRWATVFPLGMYAAMSDSAGRVGRAHGLVVFGRAWAWVALAGWVAVAVGWCTARLPRRSGS